MFGSFFKSINFLKPFNFIILIIVFMILFVSIFYTPFILSETIYFDESIMENITISRYGFVWPTPGYTTITSPFGSRVSPTAGASNFHKGIDIGAPEGTKFIAVVSGTITFVGFLGGGGYTITLSKDDLKISYCHVSPNYIVYEGEEVVQGQVIGFVGPKNVYGVVRKSVYRF